MSDSMNDLTVEINGIIFIPQPEEKLIKNIYYSDKFEFEIQTSNDFSTFSVTIYLRFNGTGGERSYLRCFDYIESVDGCEEIANAFVTGYVQGRSTLNE